MCLALLGNDVRVYVYETVQCAWLYWVMIYLCKYMGGAVCLALLGNDVPV